MRYLLPFILAPNLAFAHPGHEDCFVPSQTIQGDASTIQVDVPTLLYVGYAECRDVCPADNMRNSQALALAQTQGMEAQALFSTVDPNETLEQVARFASYFRGVEPLAYNEDLLTDLLVFAEPRDTANSPWDHSPFTYLVQPGVGVVGMLGPHLSPEEVADALMCLTPHEASGNTSAGGG